MKAGGGSTSPETTTAEQALDHLLHEPLEACLDSGEACLEHVRAIGRAYRQLQRARLGADRVLDLKFACLYWRRRLLSRLHHAPPVWLGADDNTFVDVIGALNTRLPDSLLARLAHRLPPRAFHQLHALQGRPSGEFPDLDALAGPGVTLDIKANRSSPWPFSRWKRNPAFANYRFEGPGVRFRGMSFQPGDILLANVNIDGNGVYTTLSDPTRFASHAAVVAVLEDEDGRYPAVIETYEKGVRAVPLNVFLDGRFSAYVEVYRHKDLDETRAGRINRSALTMLDRVRGYNFNTVEDDWDYVSCCGVGRLLHLEAGLEPASLKSRIEHPRIRSNLEKLGYRHFEFFAPVDYLLDTRFECVGWVDNHQFESLLARELVENRFRELFMTRTLQPHRFPFTTRINRWGIGHIRRRSLLGRLIGRVEGFDHRTLPKGPDPLLAVITAAEAQVGEIVRRTRSRLEQLDHETNAFSLAEFSNRADVRGYVDTDMKLQWLE